MEVEADSKSESDASSIFCFKIKLETFLGTTKKGIGPTYASKANRYGLRIGDLRNWELFT